MLQPNKQSQKQSQPPTKTPSATPATQYFGVPFSSSVVAAAPTHGDISQRAYDIYTESGYMQGQSLLNWVRAEKDLRERGAVTCQDEHRRKGVFAPDAADAQ